MIAEIGHFALVLALFVALGLAGPETIRVSGASADQRSCLAIGF